MFQCRFRQLVVTLSPFCPEEWLLPPGAGCGWTIWTRTAMWELCWSQWPCSRAADSQASSLARCLFAAISVAIMATTVRWHLRVRLWAGAGALGLPVL